MTRAARLLPLLCTIALAMALLVVPGASAAEPAATTPTETTAAPTTSTEAPASTETTTTTAPAPEAPPQVQGQISQGATRSPAPHRAAKRQQAKSGAGEEEAAGSKESPGEVRANHKAVAPSTLTPSLPLALRSSLAGVPSFFIESFRIPPFLLPIYQAAGTAYGIPWQLLAAINEVETDYGRDLSVSSASAEGWMQFLPSSWAQYGVDANGDGFRDPYNPADAIFAAARYLRAAGAGDSLRQAVFAYNHSQAYVESVMLRAQLLGGTPSELLGAITGLTEAHFPVHAAAHFSDGFPTAGTPPKPLVGTVIYADAGAPVIAVQDGEVVQIGHSSTLGHFLRLRDAFGNTYTYAQLGSVASQYPVLQPHVHSTVSPRLGSSAGQEPAPTGPASAGAQPRSPISEAGTVSALALGAAAGLEASPTRPAASPQPARPAAHAGVKMFRSGSNDVYLHGLRAGVQVIAGTVLGHVGAATPSGGLATVAPHLLFQVRPAGAGAPLIDPKPILDGWVALENTSIFRAKGENPFLATSPSIGQVLLESKQQLAPQVLHDAGIRLSRCGRQDVAGGRVDRRVLAMLEYLSVSGLKPTVAGLKCSGSTPAAQVANASADQSSNAVDITAINGIPIAGHESHGEIGDTTVRKLLMLQGLNRPQRIVSALSYPSARVAHASSRMRTKIRVVFGGEASLTASISRLSSILSPAGWIKLTARLGEIPDPTVARGPSAAAIPDNPTSTGSAGGNH